MSIKNCGCYSHCRWQMSKGKYFVWWWFSKVLHFSEANWLAKFKSSNEGTHYHFILWGNTPLQQSLSVVNINVYVESLVGEKIPITALVVPNIYSHAFTEYISYMYQEYATFTGPYIGTSHSPWRKFQDFTFNRNRSPLEFCWWPYRPWQWSYSHAV